MGDRKIVLSISRGVPDIPDLADRIVEVFGTEIEAEIERGAPVDSGYLKEHWTIEWPIVDHKLVLGTNASHAPFLTTGTGLYGPRHRRICARGYRDQDPTLPQYLRFFSRKTGSWIFRRCVRGIRPIPYVEKGIEIGCENALTALQQMADRGDL